MKISAKYLLSLKKKYEKKKNLRLFLAWTYISADEAPFLFASGQGNSNSWLLCVGLFTNPKGQLRCWGCVLYPKGSSSLRPPVWSTPHVNHLQSVLCLAVLPGSLGLKLSGRDLYLFQKVSGSNSADSLCRDHRGSLSDNGCYQWVSHVYFTEQVRKRREIMLWNSPLTLWFSSKNSFQWKSSPSWSVAFCSNP